MKGTSGVEGADAGIDRDVEDCRRLSSEGFPGGFDQSVWFISAQAGTAVPPAEADDVDAGQIVRGRVSGAEGEGKAFHGGVLTVVQDWLQWRIDRLRGQMWEAEQWGAP